MSSSVSNIPQLKRTLTVFESGLDRLVSEYADIRSTIERCSDQVPADIIDDVLAHLDQKFDFSFMDRAIQDLAAKIKTAETELLNDSDRAYALRDRAWFVKNLEDSANDLLFDKDSLDYLKLRLSNFNDYTHNGLEIGCGLGYWYEWLAALSPLYQADINWSFFSEISKRFQPLFFASDRMRFVKTTGTNLPGIDLDSLDFVFSWNTFNYLPTGVIENYLKSMWTVMKPGSYAIIGYTNAYLDDAYDMVVKGHWSYNTSDKMTTLVKRVGFEPRALYDMNQKGSWIEFVKPGEKIHEVDYPNPGQGYCKKVF